MSEGAAELSSFFEVSELDLDVFEHYSNLAYESARTYERLGELVTQHAEQGDALKTAVGYLILGRFQQALEWFGKAGSGKYRHYYAARAAAGLNRHEEAISSYQKAAAAGWDSFEIDMLTAALRLQAGDQAAAEKLISYHERDGRIAASGITSAAC
jgi:tetratricopeptide (TPR) repeat protein